MIADKGEHIVLVSSEGRYSRSSALITVCWLMWVICHRYLGPQKVLYAYLGSPLADFVFRIPFVAAIPFPDFPEAAPDKRDRSENVTWSALCVVR